MADASDVVVAVVTTVAAIVPPFGEWLSRVLASSSDRSSTTLRVRDVLAERSASRAVADELKAGR